MLGGILKITLFLNVFFLFIILLWQVAIVDASSFLANNKNDISHPSVNDNHRSASLVKRSLHSAIDQQSLIDNSYPVSQPSYRRIRNKLHPTVFIDSPNTFQSAGITRNNLRSSKRLQAIADGRPKRFRMLDADEFQEMLNSLNQEHQSQDEESKGFNSMDSIAGMQLENYWSQK